MHLTAQEEYGLRCLLQVARHTGPGPLQVRAIAEAEGLSQEYAAKLLRVLRLGGLVLSTRGATGGYLLARDAEEITVWEAIDVLGGPMVPAQHCDDFAGRRDGCVHTTECSLRALWHHLGSSIRDTLGSISIADMFRPEPAMVQLLGQIPSRARVPANSAPREKSL